MKTAATLYKVDSVKHTANKQVVIELHPVGDNKSDCGQIEIIADCGDTPLSEAIGTVIGAGRGLIVAVHPKA